MTQMAIRGSSSPTGGAGGCGRGSPLLEERLRDAGLISMVAESPEFKRLAALRSRWSVAYSPGQRCGHAAHSNNRLAYSVKPRRQLWRHVTDDELRGHLELLIGLADINSKVNSGVKAPVDAASWPPHWHRYVDRGIKVGLAVAMAAMVVLMLLDVAEIHVFGQERECVTTTPPTSVCIYEP